MCFAACVLMACGAHWRHGCADDFIGFGTAGLPVPEVQYSLLVSPRTIDLLGDALKNGKGPDHVLSGAGFWGNAEAER